VFRVLGLAFAAVLILIYVLIVAWFKNSITPLIIMAPIPLTEQIGEGREVEEIYSKAD
jgi:multidrug efflux pump subunit AcrB